MKIVNVPIADLIPAEYNPRELTEAQHVDLMASLKRFGLVDPIIVNEHKDRHNIIIGGHQRVRLWQELGNEWVPVYYVNLTQRKEQELNIRLNKNTGQFDYEALANYFEQDDLLAYGFTDNDLGLGAPTPAASDSSVKFTYKLSEDKAQEVKAVFDKYHADNVTQELDDSDIFYELITRK